MLRASEMRDACCTNMMIERERMLSKIGFWRGFSERVLFGESVKSGFGESCEIGFWGEF